MCPEGVKRDAAGAADEDALTTSRADARVLLWFATREGKQVGEKVFKDVVSAESELRQKPTPEIEASFWTAFRDLAAAVKPASVESILSTCEHPFGKHGPTGKWELGNAQRTKHIYTWSAVSVLVFLLVIQTYWYVITAFSTDLQKHRDELDGISGAMRLMNVLAEQITEEYKVNLAQIKPDTGSPIGPQNIGQKSTTDESSAIKQKQTLRDNTQLLSLIKSDIETTLADKPMLAALILRQDPEFQLVSLGSLDLENKKYRKQRLISMLTNEKTILQKPSSIFRYLFIITPEDNGLNKEGDNHNRDQTKGLAHSEADPSIASAELQWASGDQIINMMAEFQNDLKDQQLEINETINNKDLEQILSQSQSIPQILSQYLLPMLYGLLGSLTYILRTIWAEIHHVTFTRASATRYSLRWPLGMLAGVTVGLFFDPTRFAGLAAITPLGIAFLAGYGVELFFTGLDGLVRTFTRDGPERSKAEAA